jgi:hypothetical protein
LLQHPASHFAATVEKAIIDNGGGIGVRRRGDDNVRH